MTPRPYGFRELLIWLALCVVGGMALFTAFFFQMGGLIA